ncbi:MAG: DUF2202 domain-containing protein [Anaerolineae bacterium]|jgi:hypothetical protein|nr:DUF2202 domain-containing protein [Anaerolineae bacterium]
MKKQATNKLMLLAGTLMILVLAGYGSTPAAAAEMRGPESLTDAEIAGLTYMREEEKLAHDVYLALYDEWDLAIFQNIAASEQTHTEAVKTLLTRYGLEDPSEGMAAGDFRDAELQKLYDELVAQGQRSLTDALKVGAAIEEIDILDLEERLAQTTNADIRQVYTNLLKGSRNHLRAFTKTLERQTGETYQPQYLTPAAYQAIVTGTLERGGSNTSDRGMQAPRGGGRPRRS